MFHVKRVIGLLVLLVVGNVGFGIDFQFDIVGSFVLVQSDNNPTDTKLILQKNGKADMNDNTDVGFTNPIVQENRNPGSIDWQLTRVRLDHLDGYRSPWIEGYCSRQSVRAGEQLEIMVSTDPPSPFKLEIFRTGYYDGAGARLVETIEGLQGTIQPTPEPNERRLIECEWEPSVALTIPEDWVSGVYLGRLTTTSDPKSFDYWQSYVIFIVRDDRPADVLFQCSDNTWQAYNRWPNDYSLYTHPKGVLGPWAQASFDRPYSKYVQIYQNPQSIGSGEWLCFEFPFAYWLEQHGYDVTYCSNSDLVEPDLRCKAFLSIGHDEYWDLRQYRNVEQMRDSGINLLFFSGNSVCWVTPMQPSSDGRPHRIISRSGTYGGNTQWAIQREEDDGPFPERGPDEGYLMGARNVIPVNGGGDWMVAQSDHWIFEGTDMKKGDRIPGLVGWEYHGDPPLDLPGLEVVAEGTALHGGVQPMQWTSTIYSGPKENFVFNAATIFWCQGLSSPPGHMLPWSHWSRPHGLDKRAQKITHNLIQRAISGIGQVKSDRGKT